MKNKKAEKPVYYSSYEYKASRRDMATPYYSAYRASRQAGPVNSPYASRMRPVVSAGPMNAPYYGDDSYEAPVKNQKSNRKARKRANGKPARRGFWVALIVLFTLLYVAVPVLNYLQIGGLESVNGYLDLFDIVSFEDSVDENGEVLVDEDGYVIQDVIYTNLGTEDIVMGFIQGLTPVQEEEDVDGEEEDYVAEAAEEENVAVDESEDGEEEEEVEEKHYYFYEHYMANLEEAESMQMIAYYGLPVALILGVLIALIFFIRAIVGLCSGKRRKLYVFSGIMMLVVTLVGVVFGFMCTGAEWGSFMSFVSMDNSLEVQLGYGYIIMAVLSVLTLIASCFAFRSKKKVY